MTASSVLAPGRRAGRCMARLAPHPETPGRPAQSRGIHWPFVIQNASWRQFGVGASADVRSHWSRAPRQPGGSPAGEVAVRRVLLLNITYEPLTTVCLHRAVGLVLAEKADILHNETSGLVLHSASLKLAVPSVIRLRRYVRVPHRNRVPLTRAALMRRDAYLCAYCGSSADTIDHVVPRSKGGAHSWENCVASCTRCNHRKADRLISELGWTLRTDPLVPRGSHWRLIGAARDGDPQWAAYLAVAAA